MQVPVRLEAAAGFTLWQGVTPSTHLLHTNEHYWQRTMMRLSDDSGWGQQLLDEFHDVDQSHKAMTKWTTMTTRNVTSATPRA